MQTFDEKLLWKKFYSLQLFGWQIIVSLLIVSKLYQVVLFGLSNLILANAFQLTVLHTNDLHSRFDEVTSRGGDCEYGHECYGGVARIKYVVDQYRKKEDGLIFLNAGDFFQVRMLYFPEFEYY